MALLLTIDASVFVAAGRPSEPGFADSRALLHALRQNDIPLIEPALLITEIAAAFRRADGNPATARSYALAIRSLPRLTLLAIDGRLAERATVLAVEYALRGADAIYVAVALQYGARLITLDREQLERSPKAVSACRPDAALKLLSR